MILSQELAQMCVDKIMINLGHNINIMNKQGIIIASGNKERIGKYHRIAEEVIKQKKRIDVYKEDASKYEGVQNGVNMPFFYKDIVLGVIGITGDPSALEKTTKIVKMAVELMIEQQQLKEEKFINSNKTLLLIKKILKVQSQEDIYNLTQLATKAGYDLELPRVVCLLSFKDLDDSYLTNINTYNKITDNLINEVQALSSFTTQDIICNIDINKILILKTVNSCDNNIIKKNISDFYIELNDKIKTKLGKKLCFAIGSIYNNVLEIKESYEEAVFVLNYCAEEKINDEIVFINDYIIEYLFSKLPRKYLDHFLQSYAEKLKEKNELISTIKSLLKNNMSLKNAAKDLYIHRNTIIFRINKIKKLLNINPIHNDTDRILLRLIYHYAKNNN